MGITSTGVQYDARTDWDDWDPAAQREAALEQAREEQRKRERQKPRQARRRGAQLRSLVLVAGLIALFSGVSLYFGDTLWITADPASGITDASTLPETGIAVLSASTDSTSAPPESKPSDMPVEQAAFVMAAESPSAVPEQLQSAEVFVWIPKSGARYHLTDTCSGMQEAQEVLLSQAKGEGFTPCKRCKPPE